MFGEVQTICRKVQNLEKFPNGILILLRIFYKHIAGAAMKQLILFFTLTFAVGVYAADKTKSVTLTISGMTCESCANTVEKALKKVDGVKKATVNLSEKTATVVLANTKSTTSTLIRAVSDAGFTASAGTSASKSGMEKKNGTKEECGDGCCEEDSKTESKSKKESK